MIRRLTTTIFLFSLYNLLYSQVASVGLQILSGANLSYVFNSIAKYKTGITDIDRTIVGITVNDNGNGLYTEWTLDINFSDADGDGFITGSANTLPFSTVEVSTNRVGCGTCNTPGALAVPYPLTKVPTTLIEGGDGPLGADDIPPNYVFSIDKVLISYYIGANPCPCPPGNSLLGSASDFYTDEIVLTLTVK